MEPDRPSYGPFPLGDDPSWRWGIWGRVVDGVVWPWRLEVRYKARPCEHDEPPADYVPWAWDADGLPTAADSPGHLDTWHRRPCECWETLTSPPTDLLPPGGLTARKLRGINLSQAQARATEIAQNERRWGLDNYPGAKDRVDAVLAQDKRPGPGRPGLPATTHARRLAVVWECYEAGKTQDAAARRLRISAATLRETLKWARDHGYWRRTSRGDRGGPTEAGLAFIEQHGQGAKRRKP